MGVKGKDPGAANGEVNIFIKTTGKHNVKEQEVRIQEIQNRGKSKISVNPR